MSESDPEKRKEQLLAVIAEVPDDFERAHEYFSFWATNGDFERSLPYLDTMEKLHPDDVEVKRLQLDMALQLQRCDRAEKYVAILAQLNADQAGGALFRGRYELDCGDLENALREFRTVEREFPNDASLKVRIAQTLLRMKPPRLTEALQSLELAVEFDPRSFAAQSLLYTCYEELGRGSEGIEHLRIAAELNPNNEFIKKRKELLDEELDPRAGIERREQRRAQNPDDVNNLVRLAQLYQRVGDNEQAGARLNEAVQLDPSNLRAVRGGLTLYADVGDRAAGEKLMDAYAQSQKETVGKVFASVMRAQFYERLGDVEAAYTAYQRACDDSAAMPKDKPADRRRAIARSTREMAEFFRRNNRAEDMIEAYRVVLDNLEKDDTPSIQVCRRAIIRGYLALRQFGEARKELDGYRRDYPDDAAGMLAEAELLVSQPNRQLDDARKLLTRVLDEYPDNAWARYMRGRINMAQGRYEEARDDLLHAKSVSPEGFNLQHRLSLVRLYEITERSDLAEAELREMLSIDRSDRSVELELVNLLNRTGQYEKAQEFVSQMIAADPSEPFWRYQLGLALETREEYSAAVEPYRKAIEIMHQRGANPPENVCVHLISCLVRGNRAAEALQFYDSLGPLTVTPRIQTAAAEACLAADRHDLAVGLVEQAVGIACRRTTGELRSVVARAMTDEMLGRDETLEIVRRVLANPPSEQSELVLKNILALYLATDKDADKRAEGGRLLKSVLDATKPGEEAHVDALLVKAQLTDVEGGDPEAVIAIYEEVLRESPDNLQALNNLAYRLADVLDRPAEALPYAERLSDLASDNANVLDTVAWVEFKNGKNDEAVATLQDVLRMAPDHLAARFHLGLIYAKAGQRTAAKRSLRRALELAVERDNKDYQTKAQEALNNLR